MIDVVGLCFKRDNEFLIVMPRSSKTTRLYTLIGGKKKQAESIDEAVCRECQEELGIKLEKSDYTQILEFQERAGSDPNLMINMNMFLSEKEVGDLPDANDEILEYKWFRIGDDEGSLCDSIKLHLLPYLRTLK